MKISNIKYQISKIQIKNKISPIFNLTLLLLVHPISAFAHEAELPHEEPVPTINPLLLVGLVIALAIVGFILWKFVLQPQEKTVSQNNKIG